MQIFPLSNLQVPNKGKVFLCLAVFYASVKIGQEAVSFCKFPKACSPQNHLTEFSSLTCFSMHFVKLPGVIQVFNEIVRSYFHLLSAIRFYSIRLQCTCLSFCPWNGLFLLEMFFITCIRLVVGNRLFCFPLKVPGTHSLGEIKILLEFST